jgi:hypothetical protein
MVKNIQKENIDELLQKRKHFVIEKSQGQVQVNCQIYEESRLEESHQLVAHIEESQ